MNESPEIGEITIVNSLALTAPTPLTEHPAAVYLAALSPGSRSAMKQALDAIAKILTSNECDALTLNWAELRYKHTALLRCILMERYAPATANKMLSALRRVLKEALRLELMDARDFARAVDIPNIKLSKELKGRFLSEAEITAVCDQVQYKNSYLNRVKKQSTMIKPIESIFISNSINRHSNCLIKSIKTTSFCRT